MNKIAQLSAAQFAGSAINSIFITVERSEDGNAGIIKMYDVAPIEHLLKKSKELSLEQAVLLMLTVREGLDSVLAEPNLKTKFDELPNTLKELLEKQKKSLAPKTESWWNYFGKK